MLLISPCSVLTMAITLQQVCSVVSVGGQVTVYIVDKVLCRCNVQYSVGHMVHQGDCDAISILNISFYFDLPLLLY